MRAYFPDYELRAPKSLHELLATLQREPGVWTPFAGGTDLMVVFETGRLARKKFLSIWKIPELHGIRETRDRLELGALTTYSEILAHPVLRAEFPLLCQAARETGAVAIQNRGTIGGNIANASPAADSPPALLAYDTELELVSEAGSRRVPYETFHTGYKQTVMRPNEVIRSVTLKRRTEKWAQYYRKAGTRKAQAISKVCLAAAARLDGAGRIADARVAFGAVAPTPVRLTRVESLLSGRAVDTRLIADARHAVEQALAPIDDIRSTAVFRRAVAANLIEDFLCGIGSASSPS